MCACTLPAYRYYLKVDDDIVWIADGAIEAMLEEKLRGRLLYLSGNVINHSILALVQSIKHVHIWTCQL